MKKIIGAAVLAALLRPAAVQATWFGNPAEPIKKGASTLEFLYETGDRDVKNTNGTGSTSELTRRGFFLQGRAALGDTFQAMGRFLPGTGRVAFPNSSFNPNVWGGGVGLRFSPPEAVGAVRLGVLGAWDWMFGETERDGLIPVGPGHDRINWAEGSVAAGVSVEVLPMLNVYGGASLVKPDIHLDVGGVESNLENDGVFGGFLGLGVKPNDAWTFGVESHFGNESTIGFSIEYFFGGRS